MNNQALPLINTIFIGLGATLITDLWALLLKRAFKIAAPNYCLVGRWPRYMPEGTFTHSNIASAPQRSAECTVGWIAHYLIGITFAIAFVALVGNNWLQHPTLIPAIVFGSSQSWRHSSSCSLRLGSGWLQQRRQILRRQDFVV